MLFEKPKEFWESVIFVDESKFNVFGSNGKQKVWRRLNTELKLRNLRATVKHGVGSHFVWGCMSSFGTGNLELIDSKVNNYGYLDILKRNIRQNAQKMEILANFKLYQDNHPKHTSHICRLWALYHCPMVIKTPAQSPDLNPIEHLWDNIQQCLHENNITSKNILKEKLIEAWRNIDPNTCKKLVNSMPSRLKEVIKNKGRPTKY
ncbi:Transposable element Tcb1 transposase [Araneus ventricosus]|uniref:Transposable element Tcb1 transposase n=1 Tax=Araneus ventricosus TaxID=182803 RepID=A0A4Y2RQR6_ARAVE|nr:Transposable element Tcb1 transposase [Araneus ventricosus]